VRDVGFKVTPRYPEDVTASRLFDAFVTRTEAVKHVLVITLPHDEARSHRRIATSQQTQYIFARAQELLLVPFVDEAPAAPGEGRGTFFAACTRADAQAAGALATQ